MPSVLVHEVAVEVECAETVLNLFITLRFKIYGANFRHFFDATCQNHFSNVKN